MLRYTIRRTLQIIPVFFIATFLIFFVVFRLPGDPIQAQFGERAVPEATRQAYEDFYHLDEPIFVQYGHYMKGVLTLDFGESLRQRRPVREIIFEAAPNTIKLAGLATLLDGVVGITIGVLAARRKDGWFDNTTLVGTVTLLSIPPFVLLSVAQLWVGVKWGILPVSRAEEGFKSFILPASVVSLSTMATTARLMRGAILDTYREDYIRTATAKGNTQRRVLGVHALRNALIPVVTVLGITFGALLGGTIVTESIFQIPGLGFQIVRSISTRDVFVIVGISTFLVMAYLVINLVVDLLYALIDPRIRYD